MTAGAESPSVAGRLEACRAAAPGRTAVVVLNDDDSDTRLTVGELCAGAERWARVLRARGVGGGDLVSIALPHGADLAFAFWGALYAGAVPSICTYPAPTVAPDVYVRRLAPLVRRARARAVVTFPGAAAVLGARPGRGPEVLTPADAAKAVPDADGPAPVTGDDPAYIQFTSGSTGPRKGVVLSHRAVVLFLDSLAEAIEFVPADVLVNWVPLAHDFGLFGGFLLPILFGGRSVLASPARWVRRPQSFMKGLRRVDGTILLLPNSAFRHLERAVEAGGADGVDFSSVRMIVNGSEPILHETQRRFLERFAANGLAESALGSGYGMAENVLAATLSRPGRRSPVDWVDAAELAMGRARPADPGGPRRARACVSSGVPLRGVELEIRTPRGVPLPEREVGEIFVRSPFLFSRYHRDAARTRRALRGGWYRTGDLGYLAGGHLFVCGRRSDVIIVGGRKVYPDDLEAIAASVPGVRPGRAAAFGVPDLETGTDRPILVYEPEAAGDAAGALAVEREVRRRVYEILDVALGDVRAVPKGGVRRTVNGKMARGETRRAYERGEI